MSAISGVAEQFAKGFKLATQGLDEPGADVSPHPFGPHEIPDKTSGIARVIATMIGARRDQANARLMREDRQRTRDQQDLQIQRLRQTVASGTTSPTDIGGKTYDLTDREAATISARDGASSQTTPVSAERAKKFGLTSFVPDPSDPTRGTVNQRELTAGATDFRSGEAQKRITSRAEQVDARVRELQTQRLDARSKAGEMSAALKELDRMELVRSESNVTAKREMADEALRWLSATTDKQPGGAKLSEEQFVAKRDKMAAMLGLKAVADPTTGNQVWQGAGGAKVNDVIAAYLKRAAERGLAQARAVTAPRRAALSALRDRYLGIDATLGRVSQGWQQQAPTDQWLDEPAQDPQYEDPMKSLKEWDQQDEEQ